MSGLLDSPYPFFGAKPKPIVELTWRALGDVPNFVDPFFGSGRILLGRPRPGKVETVNDKNGFISNFWRAVQKDPEATAAACDWLVSETDLYARHNYLMSQVEELTAKLEADPRYFDAELAGWWAWGASSWIGSGWCTGESVHRKMPDIAGQGSEQRVRQGKGVRRRMPHLTRNNEGEPGGGTGVMKASMRQLPRVGGCDGSGVSYGAGINTRDRRGRLVEWFLALAERLHSGPVRICCGDFERVLSPSVTTGHGLTGVVLDPPYLRKGRALGLYVDDHDDDDEAAAAEPAVRARDWAVAHGSDPLLRIVYFGYDDGFTWPAGWTEHAWKARGGYGNQSDKRGRENASRERVWFSPGCFPLEAQIGLML